MRLFTAIIFDDATLNSLYHTVEKLKAGAKKGTFTTKENLHLTVNFIGETERLEDVKQAMKRALDKVKSESFPLLMQGFGKIKRREGDIYWVGVEKSEMLWRLQKKLAWELKDVGYFDIDDMEYTPHLTLGRRVVLKEGFALKDFEENIIPMQMEVTRLSLMQSERICGKLVYTEIYHIKLNKNSE